MELRFGMGVGGPAAEVQLLIGQEGTTLLSRDRGAVKGPSLSAVVSSFIRNDL